MDETVTPGDGSEPPIANARLPTDDLKDLGLDLLAAMVSATPGGAVILDRQLRCVYACPTACMMLGYRLDEFQGRDLITSLELEQRWGRGRLAGVFDGKPARWETVLRRPDGSELDIQCTATRLESQGREFVFVLLQDWSERRRQAREAAALAQAAASAAANDSIDATVQSLAECTLQGTRALGAHVVLDDEDHLAVWVGAAGLPDGYADSVRAAVRAGWRADNYEALVAAQRIVVDRDARQRLESNPKYAGLTEVLKSIPWQSMVYAPLIYQGAVVGVLNASYRKDELPLDGEMAFLATLADQAAVVAMNARLMTAAREKVALEERQRLSRELHDSVSQAFYGIALGARTARDLVDRDPARVVQPIDYVLQLAGAGLAEMRALIFELRPESLETEGLAAALDRQVEAVRARHGIAVRTTTGEEPDAPFVLKEALYRIAQEALQNTVKHARARCVEVCLEAHGREVRLAIEDDGIGFDPDGTFPGHLGLRSMRERAVGVGGSLEVASAPACGTRILVRVPLQTQAHAARATRPAPGGGSRGPTGTMLDGG